MSFLLYASGVSSQYLQESPESDNIKYKNIGLIIIFTAFFSSLSMFYASYTSFLSAKIDTSNSLIYAISIAFSWSIFIFTIDRYFIISMTKSKNKLFEFFISLFRILLAGLIGFIISKPLIVAIFSDNIDRSLYSSYIKEVEILEKKFEKNIKKLQIIKNREINSSRTQQKVYNTNVSNYEKEKKELFKKMEKENKGKGYTGKSGKGTEYRSLEKDRNITIERIRELDEARQLIDFEIKKTKEKYDDKEKFIKDEYIKKKDGLEQHYSTSFITRLLELYKIMEKDKKLGYIIWAIMGLFMMIETSPVIVKLMTSKSAYDIYIQEEYTLAKTKYNEYKAIKVNEYTLNREFKEALNKAWKESLISIMPNWKNKMEEIYKKDIANQNIHNYINTVIGSYFNQSVIQSPQKPTPSTQPQSFIVRIFIMIFAILLGGFLYIRYGKETVMAFSSILLIILLFIKFVFTGVLDSKSINETISK